MQTQNAVLALHPFNTNTGFHTYVTTFILALIRHASTRFATLNQLKKLRHKEKFVIGILKRALKLTKNEI